MRFTNFAAERVLVGSGHDSSAGCATPHSSLSAPVGGLKTTTSPRRGVADA
jgi:hypothetical protein